MVSAARQKIDRQTMQMFDAEVDRPEHDRILTTLFHDDVRLTKLLMRLHSVQDLVQPSEAANFEVWEGYRQPGCRPNRMLSWQEAVALGGAAPVWKNTCPIRELSKTLEAPLYMETGPRSQRVMGFIDMFLQYWMPGPLHLVRDAYGKYSWVSERATYFLMVEVKSVWPSAGNLLRQLNLYRACSNETHRRRLLVVGPDDSMNDLTCAHGWRLAHFNADLSSFWLAPPSEKKTQKEEYQPNEF
ncbi:MAG: hypothetical protein PHU77_00495 [Simplicispira sp.]|nr:hypothetical protein [Simplicispira sp.]